MSVINVERLIEGVMIREGAGVKLHRYIGIERPDDFEPYSSLDPVGYMEINIKMGLR